MKRLIMMLLAVALAITATAFAGVGAAAAEVNPVTPSTNDLNRASGYANVDVTPGPGTASLTFKTTNAWASCFEYRTDGNTNQQTSASNHNPLVGDGLYPYMCVNGANPTKSVTVDADEFVEVRMVFGAEADERFDWTRFDVLPPVCTFATSDMTKTLDADCDTDKTIKVPNGFTLDGNGHKITAVDPAGGAFAGAVVENDGAAMNVKDLKIDSTGANNCVAVFNGVAFMHASGSIKNVTLNNIGRQTGCQGGRAILVNAIGDTTKRSVTIEGNTVTSYNKNGIDVRGNVDAKIVGNTVTGRGPIGYIAQNGIVLIGASALIEGNVVSGNSYLPTDVESYGILVIDATGVKKKQNTLSGNEADFGNFGRGGGKTNA